MARGRRARHAALALQRALHADKIFPRVRDLVNGVLAAQAREYAHGGAVEVSAARRKEWADELARVLKRPVYAMVAHGWKLTAAEFGHEFEGKALVGGVNIGAAPRDFLLKADFTAIDHWVKTTALSAAGTSATRLENIFRRAAATVTGDEDHPAGVTPREIAGEILSAGLAQTEARAKMLAHTGAIWSYNEGAMQRYHSEGVAVVEWLTADDDLRCPFCADMNGKAVETKEPFYRAGEALKSGDQSYKGGYTVQHPPLHPNCRCTLLPVVE